MYPMTQKSLVCGLLCSGDLIKIDFIKSFCCVRICDVYMLPFKNTSQISIRICLHEVYWEGNKHELAWNYTVLEI